MLHHTHVLPRTSWYPEENIRSSLHDALHLQDIPKVVPYLSPNRKTEPVNFKVLDSTGKLVHGGLLPVRLIKSIPVW